MDWFYVANNQQAGPVPEAALDDLLRSGTISGETLVWHSGLAEWQPLRAARPGLAPAPPIIPQTSAVTHCAECRKVFPQSEMAFLNRSWVCAACKPIFLQRMMEGAAPASAAGLVWRSHRQMILRSETPLPDRCVRCNAPANGFRLKRKLYWHSPYYYLLILISLLVYVIVALCVRKKATIQVGLCEAHRKQRGWFIAASWLAVLAGLALIIIGIAESSGWVAVCGVLAFLWGAIFGALKVPVVSAAKMDRDLVWVKGACPGFLAELPEWSGPL